MWKMWRERIQHVGKMQTIWRQNVDTCRHMTDVATSTQNQCRHMITLVIYIDESVYPDENSSFFKNKQGHMLATFWFVSTTCLLKTLPMILYIQ